MRLCFFQAVEQVAAAGPHPNQNQHLLQQDPQATEIWSAQRTTGINLHHKGKTATNSLATAAVEAMNIITRTFFVKALKFEML